MDGHATKRPCVHVRRAHTAITTKHGGRFVLVFLEFDDSSPSFQRVFHTPHCGPHDPVGLRVVYCSGEKGHDQLGDLSFLRTTGSTLFFSAM